MRKIARPDQVEGSWQPEQPSLLLVPVSINNTYMHTYKHTYIHTYILLNSYSFVIQQIQDTYIQIKAAIRHAVVSR